MATKKRLDVLIREKGLRSSREKAKREIMAGNVFVNGQLVDKAGTKIDPDSAIEIRGSDQRFVSRGGKKLEKALQEFDIDPSERLVIDIGASTGGFTDCLLQHGARRVWAVDVGKGQLDWKLRTDNRVTVMEERNARYLNSSDIGPSLDLATIDVSFISLKHIIPAVNKVLSPTGEIIALVKPQFEAGPEKVENGGQVTDPEVHLEVLQRVARYSAENAFQVRNCTFSPITGKSSHNIEYLVHLRYGEEASEYDFSDIVHRAGSHHT